MSRKIAIVSAFCWIESEAGKIAAFAWQSGQVRARFHK